MELTMKSDVQIMRSFARKLAAATPPAKPSTEMVNDPIPKPKAKPAASEAPTAKPEVKKPADSSWMSMLPDMSNIDYGSAAGGLAGGIGAGMGARGLANMFRSKEDEEEGKTPWWANAAGVGAGVGGAVLGANYLPQLLSMLTSAGQSKAPVNPNAVREFTPRMDGFQGDINSGSVVPPAGAQIARI
jgi:hypothetical protein